MTNEELEKLEKLCNAAMDNYQSTHGIEQTEEVEELVPACVELIKEVRRLQKEDRIDESKTYFDLSVRVTKQNDDLKSKLQIAKEALKDIYFTGYQGWNTPPHPSKDVRRISEAQNG